MPSNNPNASAMCLERNFKHGYAARGKRIAEYHVWATMIKRCYNKNCAKYPRYGGRGITVYGEWRTSFAMFFKDVGSRPTPSHVIDRIDNDGNYEPGNVRWATRTESSRNRTRTKRIEINGVTKCAAAWDQQCGFKPKTVLCRWNSGWRGEKLLTPIKRKDGVVHSVEELARILGE